MHETSPLIEKNRDPCLKPTAMTCLAVIIISIILTAVCIALGYFNWPSVDEGCTPYNCSYAIDAQWSYCSDSRSIYGENITGCYILWVAIVNNMTSRWNYGMHTESCAETVTGRPFAATLLTEPAKAVRYKQLTDQLSDEVFSDGCACCPISTSIQPYPNNTICYEPPTCHAFDVPWIKGWNCFPIFVCKNIDREYGRSTFLVAMVIAFGIMYAVCLLSWMVWICKDEASCDE